MYHRRELRGVRLTMDTTGADGVYQGCYTKVGVCSVHELLHTPALSLDTLCTDILQEIISRITLQDMVALTMTCRAMHAAVEGRVCAIRATLARKRTLVRTLRWSCEGRSGFKSPRQMPQRMCPYWFADSDCYIVVSTTEWATPGFTRERATRLLAPQEVVPAGWMDGPGAWSSPSRMVLYANGTEADTDATVARLCAWFPNVCREVDCLKVISDGTRHSPVLSNRERHSVCGTAVRNDHLAPFCGARFLSIVDCDQVTDEGLMQFTHMDTVCIFHCPAISGAFIEPLATQHALVCIEDWIFHIGEVPRNVVVHPSALLRRLIASRAFLVHMNMRDDNYENVYTWGHGEPCDLTPECCRTTPPLIPTALAAQGRA